MKESSDQLRRLLRAAAPPNDTPVPMPFGFDTRVLAHWRDTVPTESVAVRQLLRRVVLLSLAVIVLSLAGTYQEFGLSGETELLLDQDAIADSAIDGAFDQ